MGQANLLAESIGHFLAESDFQFVIAEVAVALTGFAALVTVVARRIGVGEARAQTEAQQLRAIIAERKLREASPEDETETSSDSSEAEVSAFDRNTA